MFSNFYYQIHVFNIVYGSILKCSGSQPVERNFPRENLDTAQRKFSDDEITRISVFNNYNNNHVILQSVNLKIIVFNY